MTGLLLHLSGPLQSWGSTAQANIRPTHRTPTRSGLLGMMACGLGRRRGQDNSDLTLLGFTIRVDRPGTLLEDYHTIGAKLGQLKGLVTASGVHADRAALSSRYYLSDAAFTVAVTGPEDVIGVVEEGLRNPVWTLHLGRRSCLPDVPVLLGRFDDPVAQLDVMPVHATSKAGLSFIHDAPQSGPGVSATQFVDDPVMGSSRSWAPREVWEVSRESDAPIGGVGTEFLASLEEYLTAPRG